jgi:hypothetical protein
MTFGDAEAVAILVIEAGAGGVRVSADLVGYSFPDPWVVVHRTGGLPSRWLGLDNATIEVAVYGGDKTQSFDLAETARAALFAARGNSEYGLTVFDVVDVAGIAWSPDAEDPTLPRYTFTVNLQLRSLA